MTWVANLSITISTIVIFLYLTVIISRLIIENSEERDWSKEKYYHMIGFLCWLIFNILQWIFLKI